MDLPDTAAYFIQTCGFEPPPQAACKVAVHSNPTILQAHRWLGCIQLPGLQLEPPAIAYVKHLLHPQHVEIGKLHLALFLSDSGSRFLIVRAWWLMGAPPIHTSGTSLLFILGL